MITDPDLIDRAKNCDLLALTGRYSQLKRVASTCGGEYAGPCPLCPGGRDRFRVQPAERRWLCRHCTEGEWQDAITFQMRVARQSFPEAVQALAGDAPPAVPVRPLAPKAEVHHAGPPPSRWQSRAKAFIDSAVADLWGPRGERARAWLYARGLDDDTLRRWRLGYLPEDQHEAARRWGLDGRPLYLPRGILIPAEAGGATWYLKIRRPAGDPKYTQVRGGLPALYLADTLQGEMACVTEGELDALLLWQSLQHAENPRWRAMGVATLGSQSNRLDLAHWARYLYRVKHLLLFYDQDGKSTSGVRHWTALTERTFVVKWHNLRPGDKDLTDYHLAGGNLLDLVAAAVMQLEAARCKREAAGSGTWPHTLVWPADSKVPVIGGQWERLSDGRIMATYANREELALVLAAIGREPTQTQEGTERAAE